jgi:hypothetical protein
MSYEFLETKKCVYCGHSFRLLDSIGVLNCYYHPKPISYDRELDEDTYNCCGKPYYHYHGCQKKSHSDLHGGHRYHNILISDLETYRNHLSPNLRDFMINEKVLPGTRPTHIKISIYPIPKREVVNSSLQSEERVETRNFNTLERVVSLEEQDADE